MCNAWNHPPSCICGWGGIGRGPSQSIDTPSPDIPYIHRSLHSYTIPNATCPICGATVFYYWNIYGSSVLFDSLGPPWPKHPCTDNTSLKPRGLSELDLQRLRPQTSLPTGWTEFIIETVTRIDSQIVKVEGTIRNGEKVQIYLFRKRQPRQPIDLNRNSIAFLRNRDAYAELEYLNSQCEVISQRVYFSASDARAERFPAEKRVGSRGRRIIRKSKSE